MSVCGAGDGSFCEVALTVPLSGIHAALPAGTSTEGPGHPSRSVHVAAATAEGVNHPPFQARLL